MNKIIRQNYPASNLPKELRPGADPAGTVTVTVVEEDRPEKVMTLDEIFSLSGFRRRSREEIDAEVRQERDGWND